MIRVKKMLVSGVIAAATITSATATAPNGFAFGVGGGMNWSTINVKSQRWGANFATRLDSNNFSGGAISAYARWYMKDTGILPMFASMEADYLPNMQVKNIYWPTPLLAGNNSFYSYRHDWISRLTMGFQLMDFNQVDLWGILGLHATKFAASATLDESGDGGIVNRFDYDGYMALGPVLGAELRLPLGTPWFGKRTDLGLSWQSSYLPAFDFQGTSSTGTVYNIDVKPRWQHSVRFMVTFGF